MSSNLCEAAVEADCAAAVRRTLADLEEARELQTFGAYRPGEVPRFDRAFAMEDDINELLLQRVDDQRPLPETQETLARVAHRIASLAMEETS